MWKFQFVEATPFIEFIEKNKSRIIGHILKELFTDYWPDKIRYMMSDQPFIIRIDDLFIMINYLIPSDIELIIGSKEEIAQVDKCDMLQIKNRLQDYYEEEFEDGVKKELIEGRIITGIDIERFSEEFECNCQGKTRPAGGDYFSTIRIRLDSGTTLCLCGDDAIVDGYMRFWCE